MPDYNFINAASEVKPVQQTSMADMLNLARGAQAYQQAQQINPLDVQTKQLGLQQQRIATDVAQQTAAPTIAKAGSEAQTAATGASSAAMDFANKQILGVATRLTSLINDPLISAAEQNPGAVDKDKLIEKVKNYGNQQAKELGISKEKTDELIAPYLEETNNPAGFRQFLRNKLVTTLDQGSKVNALSPSGVTVNQAGTSAVVNTNPFAEGGVGQPIQGTQSGSIQEIGGIKYQVTPSQVPGGKPTFTPLGNASNQTAPATAVAPTGPKIINEPYAPHPSNAPVQLGQGEADAIKTGQALKAQVGAQIIPAKQGMQAADRVISLSDTASPTVMGQMWNKTKSALIGNTELNELAKNIAQLQVQNAAAMGVTTDAQTANVAKASGDIAITPEALRDVARTTKASGLALSAYNSALDNYIAKRGPVTGNANAVAFRDAWSNNYDPKVFLVRDINSSTMSPAEKQLELQRITKGLNDQQLRDLQTKATNIKRMERGDYQ